MTSAEQAGHFRTIWLQLVLDISADIDALESGNSSKSIQQVKVELNNISKKLDDASTYLPSYDQRQYTETYQQLNERITNLSKKQSKAFSFKKRTQTTKPTATTATTLPNETQTGTQPPVEENSATICKPTLDSDTYAIKSLDQTSFSFPTQNEHITSTSLSISACTSSTINLCCRDNLYLANLFIRACKDVVIVMPYIDGSVFVDQCTNCTFIIACQQLRVHNSTICDFYVQSDSRPIIENCSRFREAEYPLELENYNASKQNQLMADFDNPSDPSINVSNLTPLDQNLKVFLTSQEASREKLLELFLPSSKE